MSGCNTELQKKKKNTLRGPFKVQPKLILYDCLFLSEYPNWKSSSFHHERKAIDSSDSLVN